MRKLREVQGQHAGLLSSDAVDYAEDCPQLAMHHLAQELEVHIKVLKAQVKAMDADMAELRRLLATPPPIAQGAYDDRMWFMAMELMGKANVCATQVPSVIDIVARYYGIHIPEWVKGKGDDARIIPWVPSPARVSASFATWGHCRSSKWASTSSIRAAPRAISPAFSRTAPPPTAPRCRPLCWGNAPPTPPAR